MAPNRHDDDLAYGNLPGDEGGDGDRGLIGDMGRRLFGGKKEVRLLSANLYRAVIRALCAYCIRPSSLGATWSCCHSAVAIPLLPFTSRGLIQARHSIIRTNPSLATGELRNWFLSAHNHNLRPCANDKSFRALSHIKHPPTPAACRSCSTSFTRRCMALVPN